MKTSQKQLIPSSNSMALLTGGFASSILLLTLIFWEAKQIQSSNIINLGSSLLPTTAPTSWPSSSGLFAFGFYQQDNGYRVGIWLNQSQTIVWTANRDDPPVSTNSTLELNREGKLVLRNELGENKLIAANSTISAAASASMLDSGNFVLYNKDSRVIWQSFDHPTDTILGGQKLLPGMKLVSSLSNTDQSTGRFQLKMQADGNLVLYPLNADETGVYAYWDSGTFGTNFLFLNSTGILAILNGSNMNTVTALFRSENNNSSKTIIHRATLDFDGVFKLYSHDLKENSDDEDKSPTVDWEKPESPCEVKGFCGLNSYCTFDDYRPYCVCLPGTDFIDPDQRSLGCHRNFSHEGCIGGRENTTSINITAIEKMVILDVPYASLSMPILEDCKKSCLEDCYCGAAQYVGNSCKKLSVPLKYVARDSSQSGSSATTTFFKVGSKDIKSDNGTVPVPLKPPPPAVVVVKSRKVVMLILIVTIGLLTSSCAALAISGLFAFKIRVLKYKRLLEYGNLGLSEELTLQLFSYNELKKATNGFKNELGKGSFGAVYKGTLCKGKRIIAVKRLEKVVEEGEREFLAEVRAIGRTSHRNLVRLLGYCNEDSKRLLVYEYMSNGSLADLLFKSTRRPDWSERVRIALNVARGILYLHEECEAPIIHCDIKPQNILMDEFWTAKISDFGLSKLLMPDQTRTFTGVRGTRGYLAPEWQRNTPISVKVDIYSFGIVLLEIVCCRKNLEVNVSHPEEIVLSNWVYKCFVGRELNKLVGNEEIDKNTLENIVKVGLWCIQDEPPLRPSMKSVVLMLEGNTDIAIPPCPNTASM